MNKSQFKSNLFVALEAQTIRRIIANGSSWEPEVVKRLNAAGYGLIMGDALDNLTPVLKDGQLIGHIQKEYRPYGDSNLVFKVA